MSCNFPIPMYWTGKYTENGKRLYTLNKQRGYADEMVLVPCRKCLGCKMEQSRQNAVRICDEASLYEYNCFITLTVSDEHMNEVFPSGCLDQRPFQLFMKRLRKYFNGLSYIPQPKWWNSNKKWNPLPIRCVYCGEYGDQNYRPHFHAILFNFDFLDKVEEKTSGAGSSLYVSPTLCKLWPYGLCDIGEVNFNSAAYLARYVIKKASSDEVKIDPNTGLVLTPEFVQYPSGYGLGRGWIERYKDDVYNYDVRLFDGQKMRPPKFYDKKMLTDDKKSDLIRKRRQNAIRSAPKQDLNVKEELLSLKVKRLKRSI